MKVGMRESVISFAVFLGVIVALTTVDPNLHQRLGDVVSGGGVSQLSGRASDVGGALWTALRTQSIENAPMVVFATVGVLLTLFMFKS